MAKSRTLSAPKAGARSSFQIWAAQTNHFLSALLEQKINNKQMLLILHCLFAFFMFIFLSGHLITASIGFIWFALSLFSAKKGGLK